MRTEREMMELIINTAKYDERIRAIILNGSRANDFILKDKYQDYDIIYFVTDFEYFVNDKNWIDIFGDRIMLEMPAYKDFEPNEYNGRFNFQMLFTDGNRIDLSIVSINRAKEAVENDKVGRVLLDKDNRLVDAVFDNGRLYFVKKPTKKEFENKCNSFWWVIQNVAKGVKRKELPYAMQMLNITRGELDDMVSWYIGMHNDYQISSGKMGKYFEKYLDCDLWEKYVSTFPIGDYEAIWLSLNSACELFRQLATEIADEYSYDYPCLDDKLMTNHLNQLRTTNTF